MFFKNDIVMLKNNLKTNKTHNKILKCISDEFIDESGASYIYVDTIDKPILTNDIIKYRTVYKITDNEWYVTPWSLEDTIIWYSKKFESIIDIKYVVECDLETTGMWILNTDEEIKQLIGDSEYYSPTNNNRWTSEPSIGDLIKDYDGSIYKFTAFKDVIKEFFDNEPLLEPELIATL